MRRITRLRRDGWRVDPILVTASEAANHPEYTEGEDLGFWRLVNPDGAVFPGWTVWLPSSEQWGFQANCFDGRDEGFEFAEFVCQCPVCESAPELSRNTTQFEFLVHELTCECETVYDTNSATIQQARDTWNEGVTEYIYGK